MKHPMHAGDLPPLPSSGGYAWLAYYNANLELYDIVGRSVIVHRNSDDFRSQPSGDAGEKMEPRIAVLRRNAKIGSRSLFYSHAVS